MKNYLTDSEFAAKVVRIATHLCITTKDASWGASIAQPLDRAYLTRGSDGLHLFVTNGLNNAPGTITVAFSRPCAADGAWVDVYLPAGHRLAGAYGKLVTPSIGLSANKDANRIAADIVRRLLPNAEEAFKLITYKIRADEDYQNERQVTLAQLECAFHLQQKPGPECTLNFGTALDELAPGYGTVAVGSKDSTKFEIHPKTRADAVKLAKALARLGY